MIIQTSIFISFKKDVNNNEPGRSYRGNKMRLHPTNEGAYFCGAIAYAIDHYLDWQGLTLDKNGKYIYKFNIKEIMDKLLNIKYFLIESTYYKGNNLNNKKIWKEENRDWELSDLLRYCEMTGICPYLSRFKELINKSGENNEKSNS